VSMGFQWGWRRASTMGNGSQLCSISVSERYTQFTCERGREIKLASSVTGEDVLLKVRGWNHTFPAKKSNCSLQMVSHTVTDNARLRRWIACC
jgi:hypothetical protein